MKQCFRFRRMRWITCACLASVSATALSATIRDDLTQAADIQQTFTLQAQAGGDCPSSVPDPFCPFEDSTSDERAYTVVDDSDASISLCISWTGSASVNLVPADEPDSISTVEAAAGGGQAIASGFTGEASTDVSYILLNGNRDDFGTVAASTDPQTEQPETVTVEKPFTVKDGDTIRVGLAVAAAAKVKAGRTGDALASSQITLRIGPCASPPIPPTPVPTLSQWSLILTALLLAGLGYVGLRRRQR